MLSQHQFVLTLACRNGHGIVHPVAELPYQAGCNISTSQQLRDLAGADVTGPFFTRRVDC